MLPVFTIRVQLLKTIPLVGARHWSLLRQQLEEQAAQTERNAANQAGVIFPLSLM